MHVLYDRHSVSPFTVFASSSSPGPYMTWSLLFIFTLYAAVSWPACETCSISEPLHLFFPPSAFPNIFAWLVSYHLTSTLMLPSLRASLSKLSLLQSPFITSLCFVLWKLTILEIMLFICSIKVSVLLLVFSHHVNWCLTCGRNLVNIS